MPIEIRPAEPADAETIVEFIVKLAEFEKADRSEVKVTAEDIRRHGFGERPAFECLIAELHERPVGFALFFTNFSTWEGRPGIYLEDLYVDEEVRGHRVGHALMAALARLAVERGGARLDFAVLDWNPARHFYSRVGAAHMQGWLPYRLTGEPLRALAANGH